MNFALQSQMRQVRNIIFLSVGLFLAGCSHCYRARPIPLVQTDLGQNVSSAFTSSTVEEGDFVCGPWWEFFQDPQLSDWITLSLASHPTLKVAEARITLACQKALEVRASLFPHLFGFGDLNKQKISKLGTEFIAGKPSIFTEATFGLASSFYELDIWQKNRSLYMSALDQMHRSEAEAVEVELLLSTALAGVYFEWQMHAHQKEVVQKRVKAREELYQLLKQLFDRGVISEYRLYETDSEVALLKNHLIELEALVALDQHALAALVGNVAGFSIEQCAQTPCAEFNAPFPLPSTLPIDLLRRRPDITALKWQIEASCFDIKAARANFYPRIDLYGMMGLQSIELDKIFRGEAILGMIGGLGTLPLFTAGKLKAQLGVAQEQLEIAIETYNEAVLRAVKQVSDALTDLKAADQSAKMLHSSVQDATSLLSLTTQKFESGISNKIALLNALENVYLLEEKEIEAQLARFEAAVDLIRSIGGGYFENCRS